MTKSVGRNDKWRKMTKGGFFVYYILNYISYAIDGSPRFILDKSLVQRIRGINGLNRAFSKYK